jgi:hypothetical protein
MFQELAKLFLYVAQYFLQLFKIFQDFIGEGFQLLELFL